MPQATIITPKDTTRIGEIAAQQPLSGNKVVTDIRVKGFNSTTYQQIEEPKKSA